LDWTKQQACTPAPINDSSSTTWERRHTAGTIVHNNEMWVIGGDPLQGHYQNDVWKTSDGETWSRVTNAVPWKNRALHYTCSFNNRIFLMGGQKMPQFITDPTMSGEALYNDVWSSADGVDWQQHPNAPWSPRGIICGNVVFNNQLWVIGGGTYDTPLHRKRNYYNDVWSSTDGNNWIQQLDEAPFLPREYHNVIVHGGLMWVLGGFYSDNGGNMNDVWYSADGTNWYELKNTPWAKRHASSVFSLHDTLWVVTGNNMERDVWALGCTFPTNAVTGITKNNVDQVQQLIVYPNPTDHLISIETMYQSGICSISDLSGKVFTKIESFEPQFEINVGSLPAGIYIVEFISSDGEISRQKLVKN
jgi:hypothetical protein